MPNPDDRLVIRALSPRQGASVMTLMEAVKAGSSHRPQDDAGTENTLLHRLLSERTLIGLWRGDALLGLGGVDLEQAALFGPFVSPTIRRAGHGARLVARCEQLAARYQLFSLSAPAQARTEPFLRSCGYAPAPSKANKHEAPDGSKYLRRGFPRRQTAYGRQVAELCRDLGIAPSYGVRHRLPLQPEARRLVDAGKDIYGRPQAMTSATRSAWKRMHRAAEAQGITLQLVSAYRSLDYQAGLLRRKLAQGQSMERILAVSAAPGFSEHHTGRALDLTCPDAPVLEEAFEDTPAFAWLEAHARTHGFQLSFPRNNRHGLLYEPWHWCYRP